MGTANTRAGPRQKQRTKNDQREHCTGRREFQSHNHIKTQSAISENPCTFHSNALNDILWAWSIILVKKYLSLVLESNPREVFWEAADIGMSPWGTATVREPVVRTHVFLTQCSGNSRLAAGNPSWREHQHRRNRQTLPSGLPLPVPGGSSLTICQRAPGHPLLRKVAPGGSSGPASPQRQPELPRCLLQF